MAQMKHMCSRLPSTALLSAPALCPLPSACAPTCSPAAALSLLLLLPSACPPMPPSPICSVCLPRVVVTLTGHRRLARSSRGVTFVCASTTAGERVGISPLGFCQRRGPVSTLRVTQPRVGW